MHPTPKSKFSNAGIQKMIGSERSVVDDESGGDGAHEDEREVFGGETLRVLMPRSPCCY